ncbi:MAG: hypothetical protein IJX30_03245 [Clostridia bacterium]|nr:hypothetical protein [Clostridia bacterium]
MRTDWAAVRSDYVTGTCSVPELAKRHGISVSSVQKKMAAEKWADQKTQYCNRIAEELQKSVADFAKNETLVSIKRMNDLAGRLMDRLEQAIAQLDRRTVTHKNRKKTIEYVKSGFAKGKTHIETIEEHEGLESVVADIDRQGLKQLASALVDVKNILTVDGLTAEKVEIDFHGAEELAQ